MRTGYWDAVGVGSGRLPGSRPPSPGGCSQVVHGNPCMPRPLQFGLPQAGPSVWFPWLCGVVGQMPPDSPSRRPTARWPTDRTRRERPYSCLTGADNFRLSTAHAGNGPPADRVGSDPPRARRSRPTPSRRPLAPGTAASRLCAAPAVRAIRRRYRFPQLRGQNGLRNWGKRYLRCQVVAVLDGQLLCALVSNGRGAHEKRGECALDPSPACGGVG